jgi:hypothetical protein
VHLDFFVDHGWGFATEQVHVEDGFDVIPLNTFAEQGGSVLTG